MSDPRTDQETRELAEFAAHFEAHPDVPELRRRAQRLVDAKHESDLAEYALAYVDSTDRRAELVRAAKEILRQPVEEMSPRMRRAVGWYLVSLGTAVVAALLWTGSFAAELIGPQGATPVRVHFLGFGFTPTPTFSLLLIVVLTAAAASFAVMSIVFASRAGLRTLEPRWEWWYLTRPLISSVIALVVYEAIVAGFFDATPAVDRASVAFAAAVGGLTGLFTDQILGKLRSMLGLSPVFVKAAPTDATSTTATG